MNLPHFLLSRLLPAALLLACTLPASAFIDTAPADGIPDIWAMKYGSAALAPGGDADGDGETNLEEAMAGTNPLNAGTVIRIKDVTIDQYGLHLVFPTLVGKRYQVRSTASLSTPVWANEGTAHVGTDADVTTTLSAAGATEKFYHVLVQDVDSDGDGVSDWEEVAVGYDPLNSHSNGANGPADMAALTAALGAANVVTVTAVDASATEPASGVPVTDPGAFTFTRTGNLNAVTINFTTTGGATAGSDYTALTGTVSLPMGVNTGTVMVTPLSDAAVESPEGVIVTVSPSANYTVGAPSVAMVLIGDNVTATGTGLRARFYNEATNLNPDGDIPPGVAPLFATVAVTRIDPVVNFTWATNPAVGVNADYFSSRWSGEVLPQYSQIYTFEVQQNRCGRLWVNGQLIINKWPGNGDVGDNASGTYAATIELTAGTRYPILYEQFDTTGSAEAMLRWSSLNQIEETIPTARLFPDTAPQITSVTEVLLIKDGPVYNYQIVGSGFPTSYNALNRPPGWTINTASGLLSGTPTQAGIWEVVLSATNANGTGNAILRVEVIETGGAITRDVWTGVGGTAVSAIPLATTPTSTGNIAPLEVAQSAPNVDDFGARIRGYITAPTSGVYKFYLTASDNAELYVSDDDEPVNALKRAQVTTATASREWSSVNAGKSPLLILTAGRRYFVEVRHKAGIGNDHVSVGWIKPGEGGNDPANYQPVNGTDIVVPGFVLTPYTAPAPLAGDSTLYTTSMTAQGGAITSGYGGASLRLSADETQAILSYNYANLTTPVTAQHIHSDAFATHNQGEIIFDIDAADPQPDGSYVWDLVPVGSFTTPAQLVDAIKGGYSYLNIHTVTYGPGEIRGNFRFQPASQTFTPPAAQTWTDPENAASAESRLNRNAASRFLIQSTFGPNTTEITAVQTLGFEGWINDQVANKGTTQHYPYVFTNRNQTNPGNSTYPGNLTFNVWWKNSVTAPDQLRQRVAFALSEIFVISENGPLDDRGDTISDYYDMLLANAFGNARTLLEDVTLHPAMGRYLDMLRNDKPDKATGRIPNENYAREIKQLFSIGLNRQHPDGSLVLNSKGELIPTYDQDAIIGFAHAFTGWDYFYAGAYRTSFGASANWIQPMREVPVRHFTGQKRLLNNVVLPGLAMVGGSVLDPYATHSAAQYGDAAYQALAAQEMDAAHDALFNHPNFGPFICRQLIQRLVTSTPSRGYLYRVVQKFENNGSGVRGDMVAIVKAILLDHEARSATLLSQQGYGKQREPIVRVTSVARGFPAPAPVTGTYTQTANLITVTTGAPHLYSSGNAAYLDFSSGSPSDPDDAAYDVASVTTNSFTVRPITSQPANYSQTDSTITVTAGTNNDFNYSVGNSMYIDFTSGTPSSPADGFYTIVTDDPDDQFVTVNPLTTKTTAYSQSDTTITFTSVAHGFGAGASVFIDFTSGSPSAHTDSLFTIVTADADTFTVTAADAITRAGNAFATPATDAVTRAGAATTTKAAYVVDRTGNVAVNYSDWNMDTTGTDLNQTPLNSPTVFNFFLPDYQFPGLLGQAGLITPEFELTSETSVIRQANFIYNGIFNTALGTSGLSSFKGGARDIFLDYREWLGIGTGPGGLDWTHNSNLGAMVDELNTRLLGGQLPNTGSNVYYPPASRSIVNARQAIVDFVSTMPITAISAAGTPITLTVANHGLVTGSTVFISNVTGRTFSPSITSSSGYAVTVTGANTFTIPVTRNNNTAVTLTTAVINKIASNASTLDRARAVIHLIVTSPDFTIQK